MFKYSREGVTSKNTAQRFLALILHSCSTISTLVQKMHIVFDKSSKDSIKDQTHKRDKATSTMSKEMHSFLRTGSNFFLTHRENRANLAQPLGLIGCDEECISKEVEMASTNFVGNMFGRINCTSLDALRCQKPGKRNGKITCLAPTKDVFSLHLFTLLISCLNGSMSITPSATLPDATAYAVLMPLVSSLKW